MHMLAAQSDDINDRTRTSNPAFARETGNRIRGLDGLRAISIAMVLLGHLCGTRYFLPAATLTYVGDIANLGVRVFFVISGYLITGLLLRELQQTKRISLRDFYYRRTLRIFPACYAYVAIIALVAATGVIQFKTRDLFHALTYTMNYHYDRSWWVGHLWSLSVEEQFYLLWPIAMALVGARRALWGAAALLLLAPMTRVLMLVYWPASSASIGEAFPTIADTIATGALAAGCGPWLREQRPFRRLIASPGFYVIPALAFVLNMKAGGRLAVGMLETLINVSIALSVVRFTTASTDFVSKVLDSKPFSVVGRLSYSIYLWQQPFLNHHSDAIATRFPLNLLLVIACATASYYFVEQPCLALREKFRPAKTLNKATSPAIAEAPHSVVT